MNATARILEGWQVEYVAPPELAARVVEALLVKWPGDVFRAAGEIAVTSVECGPDDVVTVSGYAIPPLGWR